MNSCSRRAFLSFGAGMLSLSSLLRLRAATGNAPASDTACIFVSLGGGAAHHETYDPKPDAPIEYRGEFQAIRTAVPGISFCELLPRQAALANDLAVIRSIHHNEASHIALHMVETGYFLRSIANARLGEMPCVGSVVAKVRGERNGLPAYVTLPKPFAYSSPGHLGGRYQHFAVDGDPSDPEFRIANLSLSTKLNESLVRDRDSLRQSFDTAKRALDGNDTAETVEAFQRQAFELLTGDRAREAFDLGREPDRLSDRYGRNIFGQRLVLARRLVEAGVPFVHVRMGDWDDHKGLPTNMKKRCPMFDAGIATLIEDLKGRGLHRNVLVVAMGEFGRTPRVNKDAGRDHWPGVMSVMLSGGQYKMGQAIGSSDSQGAAPTSAPYAPQSVLGMTYRHLGIDPGMTFNDPTGRPRHVLEERTVISEFIYENAKRTDQSFKAGRTQGGYLHKLKAGWNFRPVRSGFRVCTPPAKASSPRRVLFSIALPHWADRARQRAR